MVQAHSRQGTGKCTQRRTTSLVWRFMAFHTLPYVPSPSCFTTLYLHLGPTCRHLDPLRSQWECSHRWKPATCSRNRMIHIKEGPQAGKETKGANAVGSAPRPLLSQVD